jgi:nitroreductase
MMTSTDQRVQELDDLIRLRRIVKPANMNGSRIPDQLIRELLELANWAPTHAYTEPWYFVVFAGDQAQQFCKDHAELYRANTPPDRFITASYEKLEIMGKTASHIVALCMRRGDNPKIPEQEELAATACGIQNMLLGAAARNIAVYWGTGGMTYHHAMKDYLGLLEADRVLGFLYLGYAEGAVAPGKRLSGIEDKVRWVG